MLYYLDTNIVIYAVQAGMPEHQRAVGYWAALELLGHEFAISELTRAEALVLPLQPGNGPLLQNFFETSRSTRQTLLQPRRATP